MRKWTAALLVLTLAFLLPLAVTARDDCVLTVDSAAAQPEQTVTVPIRIRGNPGFTNGGFSLTYDKQTLELTDIQPGTLLGSLARCQIAKQEETGESCGYVVCASATPIEGDGILFTATFQVKKGAAGSGSVTAKAEYLRSNAASYRVFVPITVSSLSGAIQVEPAGERIKGDVNADGRINVLDVALVYDYLAGTRELSQSQLTAADMDGNGVVDKTDAILIYRRVNNRTTDVSKKPEGEQI